MDKICDRDPSKSEFVGRCGGDEKNTNDHTEPTKVKHKKRENRVNWVVNM